MILKSKLSTKLVCHIPTRHPFFSRKLKRSFFATDNGLRIRFLVNDYLREMINGVWVKNTDENGM